MTWTPPDADGDSAITGYTVTPYIGSAAQTPVQAGASATSATITGPHQRHELHVQGHRHERRRAPSPQSAASNAVTPQATIFDFATPAVVDSGDTTAVELGVKFKADYDGSITGIRFYKAATNTGTHIGSLWTSSGTRLAQATFTGESASGWQTVDLRQPGRDHRRHDLRGVVLRPQPATTRRPANGLASAVDNPPLHALANSTSANGVYAYGTSSTFPSSAYSATNYWVDVLVRVPAARPGDGRHRRRRTGSTSANVSWSAPVQRRARDLATRSRRTSASTAQTPKIVTRHAAGRPARR